jgi:hypothetical protein
VGGRWSGSGGFRGRQGLGGCCAPSSTSSSSPAALLLRVLSRAAPSNNLWLIGLVGRNDRWKYNILVATQNGWRKPGEEEGGCAHAALRTVVPSFSGPLPALQENTGCGRVELEDEGWERRVGEEGAENLKARARQTHGHACAGDLGSETRSSGLGQAAT